MKASDLILVQGHSFLDLGIQTISEGSFNHVAIAINETEVVEATPQGVVRSPLHFDRFATFSCVGITDEQRNKAVSYALSHLGEKYDFLRDAGFAVNAILEAVEHKRVSSLWAQHGKIVCSSLVDLSLRDGGFILREDRQAGDITPQSCIFTPKVQFVEGHNLWEI